jgi:hypothetical protein
MENYTKVKASPQKYTEMHKVTIIPNKVTTKCTQL